MSQLGGILIVLGVATLVYFDCVVRGFGEHAVIRRPRLLAAVIIVFGGTLVVHGLHLEAVYGGRITFAHAAFCAGFTAFLRTVQWMSRDLAGVKS